MREEKRAWVEIVSAALKVALALALIYLGAHYLERYWRKPLAPDRPKPVQLNADLYVHPPKSYISSFETAGKLVGMDLWVKEGCRWTYLPGERLFGPLEKITPTGVFRRGDQVFLKFEKDGKPAEFSIGPDGRLYVDDVFFIKDPKLIYKHWSDEQWEKVRAHQVELGVSEFQATFALGMGVVARTSGTSLRIVDFQACKAAGIDPLRITFRNGTAEEVEPL